MRSQLATRAQLPDNVLTVCVCGCVAARLCEASGPASDSTPVKPNFAKRRRVGAPAAPKIKTDALGGLCAPSLDAIEFPEPRWIAVAGTTCVEALLGTSPGVAPAVASRPVDLCGLLRVACVQARILL
jgi:hypothetical protein